MFIVDDLLFRPFMLILDSLHSMAVDEAYPVDEIRDSIKENELLFEVGERSESEYRERKSQLEADLVVAREAQEQLRQKSIRVVRK